MQITPGAQTNLTDTTRAIGEAISAVQDASGWDLDADEAPDGLTAGVEAFLAATNQVAQEILELPDDGLTSEEVGQVIALFSLQIDVAAQLSLAATGANEAALATGEWEFQAFDAGPARVPNAEDGAQDGRLNDLADPAALGDDDPGIGQSIDAEWALDADRLNATVADIVLAAVDDGAGPLSAEAGEFVATTTARVGQQIMRFVSAPVVGQILEVPTANITDAVAGFVAAPDAWVAPGRIRRLIGSLVSSAARAILDLMARIGASLSTMVDAILDQIAAVGLGAATYFLGTDDVAGYLGARVPTPPEWGALSRAYNRQASRLDKAIGTGGFVLGVVSANPIAGIVLGLVGATIAVWLGSDHFGAGGVFDGCPDIETTDLVRLHNAA